MIWLVWSQEGLQRGGLLLLRLLVDHLAQPEHRNMGLSVHWEPSCQKVSWRFLISACSAPILLLDLVPLQLIGCVSR